MVNVAQGTFTPLAGQNTATSSHSARSGKVQAHLNLATFKTPSPFKGTFKARIGKSTTTHSIWNANMQASLKPAIYRPNSFARSNTPFSSIENRKARTPVSTSTPLTGQSTPPLQLKPSIVSNIASADESIHNPFAVVGPSIANEGYFT
ncbi:uncharacterized protein LOC129579657 [Sitodiplosis mosellana]|uniref:uncharacterized protein LOC129579653 n=1 Tax=Sitodiplosis mosellana TaxID=263140 RepID=UPI002443B6E4|nr:uncharacterized protein LOC129579653 [Sitodiplosis mosellana]XP_055325800.1 uncharacterized protein LOC129579657 [Sitodiplosis mosellana]